MKDSIGIANIISISLFALFILSIITISKNTHLLLNKTVTNTISGLFYLNLILLGAIILTKAFQDKTNRSLYIILFLVLVDIVYIFFIKNRKRNKFNLCQKIIFAFVLPEDILFEFSKNDQKIKFEIEALKILANISADDKFGVEKIIYERLALKYSYENNKLVSFLIKSSLFIITGILAALISSFTEENIYIKYIKPFLEQYFK